MIDATRSICESAAERIKAGVDDLDSVRVFAHPSMEPEAARSSRMLELVATMRELRMQQQRSGGNS